jgi:hypothetical protein
MSSYSLNGKPKATASMCGNAVACGLPLNVKKRTGFTLLELMLSLGLTIVILLAISMAVDLHLRSFDSRRKQLEESQLAKALLKIIADDIRNTVQEYEQDVSGLEAMISSTAQVSGSVQGAAGDSLSSGGTGGTGETTDGTIGERDSTATDEASTTLTDEASTASQDLASDVALPAKPGIYGNQYQLQMDVSRLPRYDEYQSMLAAGNSTLGVTDIPSDIKTVTYYVMSGDMSVSTSGMTATGQDLLTSTDPNVVQRGLVRRQLDRAVSQYAQANGMLTTDNAAEVLAAEVASIEFQYFDGSTWLYQWDTEEEGSLPLAIQIIMMLEAPSTQSLTVDASQATAQDASNLHYYRLLVPVATGQATAAEDDSSLEAAGI